MNEAIFCNNADCPYKDCNRRPSMTSEKPADVVRIGNLGGICEKYAYWLSKKE